MRTQCLDCPLEAKVVGGIAMCPEPAVPVKECPPSKNEMPPDTTLLAVPRDKWRVATWVLVAVLTLTLGAGGGMAYYYQGKIAAQPSVKDTATLLASQTTVLFPSTLTYAQQTALTKGTGLAGVDFLYVEKATELTH